MRCSASNRPVPRGPPPCLLPLFARPLPQPQRTLLLLRIKHRLQGSRRMSKHKCWQSERALLLRCIQYSCSCAASRTCCTDARGCIGGFRQARQGRGGPKGRGLPVSEQARHAATLLTRCARSLASTTTARASPMPRLAVPRLSRATAVVVLRSSGTAWVADA